MPADFLLLLSAAIHARLDSRGISAWYHGGSDNADYLAWHWEPSIIVGTALFYGAYLYCLGPLRRRHNLGPAVERWRIFLFSLGVAVYVLALVSPLEPLSDEYLASAHMIQHMLLILVVAPLWILGTPPWLFRQLMRFRVLERILRIVVHPVVAFAVFNTIFLFWHLPIFYETALANENIHIVQHLSMLAAAVLNWWPAIGLLPELPSLSYPGRLIYVFVNAQPSALLSAALFFSSDVLYPRYTDAPRLWGLTPLADQQLAGLVMWVPGSCIFLLAFSIVFFFWFSRNERENAT